MSAFGRISSWIKNETACHFAVINMPNEIYGCRSDNETVTLFRNYNDITNYDSKQAHIAFNKGDYCNVYPIKKKICEVTFPKRPLIKAAYYYSWPQN